MRQAYTDDDVALLQARLEAMQFVLDEIRLKMEDEPLVDNPLPPNAGIWNGEVRIAGSVVSDNFLEDFTGTPSAHAKIFYDGVTVPAYATAVEYAATPWGDTYKIVQIKELYAAFGAYNVDRA